VFLAFGLGLLGLVLCVVPWTSASSRNDYVGQGSTSISQRSLDAAPDAKSPASPPAPGRGVLATSAVNTSVPKKLRNPYNTSRSGGDTMDWTRMRAFTDRKFFLVVGAVDGLYPGQQADLPVTFVNGQGFDLVVESAQVTATGNAQCGPANLDLADITFASPITVSARSASEQTIPFGLAASAPDACQGAAFTVTVTAKATSA
jgi:hypothetical protein